MNIYIYVFMYVHTYIYIYIYIERERERYYRNALGGPPDHRTAHAHRAATLVTA